MYNKNAWEKYSDEEFKLVMKFNDDYKDFLSKGKTERLCVELSVKEAEANGFKELSTYSSLKKGDKVYVTNKNKNFAAFVIGEETIENGLRVLGAHIDSPRLDIKQNPLYEKNGFTLLDTHYYGGVKKYQWVTIPLALYGVVCKKDGTTINIAIGDDINDPVVGISDLLIHLAGDQLQKACEKIDILDAGQAVVTKGYKTGFDYIIHVNRPKYSDIDSDQNLRKCYINILSQAAKQGIRSVGIPALSTNRYGFPEYRAANIAISTCLEFIIKYPDYIDYLNFMLYDPKSIAAYELVLKHAGKKADALVSIGKCSECGKRLRIRKSKFDEIIMNHNGVFTKYCSQCKPKE